MQPTEFKTLTAFIWSVADVLRGSFRQSEYGSIILPFVVMRRLDCLLEGTKDAVLDAYQSLPDDADEEFKAWRLQKAAETDIKVYNTSRNTFARMRNQSPKQLRDNLIDYIGHFSPAVSHVFTDNYNMIEILRRLEETETLWPVFDRLCQIDLHPDNIDNLTMGYLFEELLRKFSEMSNETAGEHFTPREIIRLCMALLMAGDEQASSSARVIRSLYDPTCGGGGGLSVGSQALHEINPNLIIQPYGQEMNPASYGICQSDMLIRGEDPENIALGNTLTNDKHEGKQFHFMFANPPYGVDWKRSKEVIEVEHKTKGFDGRFGAGLPRTSDGQLLFVQHMVSKFRDDAEGSRAAIVMNGSPLFTGGAHSGESEIRRWLLENDLIDAIVALPTDLFYNTGIQTYVYLLANRKPNARKGKVQLIDASSERFWVKMRKNLGSKGREVPASSIAEILEIYRIMPEGDHELAEFSKVLGTSSFGYREIRVERPLRLRFEATNDAIQRLADEKLIQKLSEGDSEILTQALEANLTGQVWTDREPFIKALDKALQTTGIKISAPTKKAIVSAFSQRDEGAEICHEKNGEPEADPTLRNHELVPLDQEWPDYVAREVSPFIPDAWVDKSHRDATTGETGRIGYEINFNRFFYKPPLVPNLQNIEHETKRLISDVARLLNEVANTATGASNGRPLDLEVTSNQHARFSETPNGWVHRTLRSAIKSYGFEKNKDEKQTVLSLTKKGVRIKTDLAFGKSTESYIGHQMVYPGQMVFTPRDFDATPILCGVSEHTGCISNLYIVFDVADHINPKFLEYYLWGLKYGYDYFKRLSFGMRFSFNKGQFERIPFIHPSRDEQDKIVAELDVKMNYINAAQEKIRENVQLLDDYRCQLVSRAVTGGVQFLEPQNRGPNTNEKIEVPA